MNDFTVIIENPSGGTVIETDQLELTPRRWSDQMPGGPRSAIVSVTGSDDALATLIRWLGYRIKILNSNNTVVWFGFISAVDIGIGNTTYSVDLMEMSNRVQVFYTYNGPDGSKESDKTDWAEDVESMNKFGVRELRHSADDLTLEQAAALRDRILDNTSRPRTAMSFGNDTAPSQLMCAGWYSTLDWKYYENTTGKIENLDGGETQPLGLGFESLYMGWSEVHEKNNVYDHFAQFAEFSEGDQFVIDTPEHFGTNVNGPFIVKNGPTATEQTVVSADVEDPIYFNWPDEIQGVENSFDLGNIRMEEYCLVEGSELNNRFHLISGSRDNKLFTRESSTGEINTEGWSTTEVLTQGCAVEVEEEIGDDYGPAYLTESATVTVYGIQIAQSFYNTTLEPFEAYRVGVSISKVGEPIDNVTVKICANDGGVPGATLATGTIDYTSIYTELSWQWAVMDSPVMLELDTAYFIVVQRLANNSPSNFYRVAYSIDNFYAEGSMIVHTGSVWTTQVADADLSFQVQGAVETSQQIADIVRLTGQFFDHTEIRNEAGFVTNQYREGLNTAGDEIEDLLDAGTIDTDDLSLTVTEGPTAIIDTRSVPTSGDLAIKGKGKLFWNYGGMVEAGKLVSGHWLESNNVPGGADSFIITTPVYIAFSEYDAGADRLTIRPTTAPDISDLEIVKQG